MRKSISPVLIIIGLIIPICSLAAFASSSDIKMQAVENKQIGERPSAKERSNGQAPEDLTKRQNDQPNNEMTTPVPTPTLTPNK